MKGYWKIFIQTGPVATQSGWGTVVRNVNKVGRTVSCSSSDVTPPDIQNNSLNIGNFIATEDNFGHRFDFDYRIHPSAEAAHLAWQANAARRWRLFKDRIPRDLNPDICSISIENEQRGWIGWQQGANLVPGPSIPGFTGWADCEGWQAYYTAVEIMKDSDWRYMAFAYSGGLPEEGAWEQPGMVEYLKLCAKHPDSCGVALHEYSFNDDLFHLTQDGGRPQDARGDLLFRFAYLHDACDKLGIERPKIIIKEFGYHHRNLNNDLEIVKADLVRAAEVYAQFPNIEGVSLWTAQRNWGYVNQQVEALVPWLGYQAMSREWEIEEPMSKIKFVEFIYPRNTSKETYDKITDEAWKEYKRSLGHSPDHAIAVLTSPMASDESYAVVWQPNEPEQQEAITKLETANVSYTTRFLEAIDPSVPDILTYRPCTTSRVTQPFGANPQNYIQFGLPGHDGIDYGVALGQPYHAVANGKVVWVSDRTGSGNLSNYGWHIYLYHHIDGYEFYTVYAHAYANPPVKVNEAVRAGQIVGYSGNTGVSTGPHLHFGLLWPSDTGNGYPMWRYGQVVDPAPFLEGKPAPPTTTIHRHDMLSYLRGDGRLYEVRNSLGSQERFQTWVRGSEFRQTKNDLAEQLFFDTNYIYRGWDNSAGNNRWYQQQQPQGTDRAQWIPRYMAEGESFSVSLYVQFYNWDCSQSAGNSGAVTDTRKLVKKHNTWTSRAGIALNDVIEIEWVNGGETYFYARNFGLVAWEKTHQDPNTPEWSAISEIHDPGQRPDNVTRLPGCLRSD